MPIKRPHKKSRYGCDRCRNRRVKCDEKRPSCSICTERTEPCHYSRLPRPSSPPTKRASNPSLLFSQQVSSNIATSHPETNSDSASSCFDGIPPPKDSPNSTSRLRELELMHHWSTRTYKSFRNQIGEQLRDHVVQEALKHDYLLAAMLALTSLHMAAEASCRATVDQNVSEALHYQNIAAIGLRSTLETLSPENCDAVFITSLIIMVCTIVSPPLQRKSTNHQKQSTAEAMLGMSEFMKGITSILDVSRPWFRNSPVRCILDTKYDLTTTPICYPFDTIRRRLGAELLDDGKNGIIHAICALEQAVLSGRHAVAWVLRVKPEFLAALRDGDEFALAVFMQWGVLLDQLDELWWARFAGRLMVEEIACKLDEIGGGWEEVTRWCRKQVGL